MNAIVNTHLSTVRTMLLSSAVLALALVGSGDVGVSALWAAPLLAVAACVMKLIVEHTFSDDDMPDERPIELFTGRPSADAFV